ncbi:MAG: beta-lactamase family protein, partial [bacterium]|nr:beta-lactamase family protein [bacterium]
MKNTPFRILFREFLFRVVDLELLAPKGDMSKLLGQFAALLIFVSLCFTAMSLGVDDVRNMPHQLALLFTWSGEHLLIATTMLVVGLFAVLSWDSTFPNQRDVFVLAPLPVRARTLFLAKVAAIATALSLTVVSLHAVAGLAWPAALHSVAAEQPTPALNYLEPLPPADLDDLEALLNRDLAQALTPGIGTLAPETGVGAVIGVVHHGERRILAYGTAEPDSIFEIGSITKTFTGLLLAQLVEQGRTGLDSPVRALLPRGTVGRPTKSEISLLNLATHRSGLPPMPDNFRPADRTKPYVDYSVADLYADISTRGVGRPPKPPFEYSNLGYGLLGQALANRGGLTYPELLRQEITGPLGMEDTVIALSPEQRARFLTGVDMRYRPNQGWDMDVMAPAGGIRSTASDMLTYLEAQLNPESAGSLAEALKQSHRIRADVVDGL